MCRPSSKLVSTDGTNHLRRDALGFHIGPALHVGDVFQLFPAAAVGFSGISLPLTDSIYDTILARTTWRPDWKRFTVLTVQPPVGTNILFRFVG